MNALNQTPAWHALAEHQKDFPVAWAAPTAPVRQTQLGDYTFDYSRHPITDETLKLLFALARQEDFAGWRAKLFSGGVVNTAENRTAEHWALRCDPLRSDFAEMEERLWQCANAVRDGTWRGSTGQQIDTVISIGIGGSELGAHLAVDALQAFAQKNIQYRFVPNIDPIDLAEALEDVRAESTLFIIASKGFATLEVMVNADRAKAWLQGQLGNDVDISRHFVAATSNVADAEKFGIPAANCFGFPATIGGRFSMWGPIGLIVRIALGREHYRAFIAGARMADDHFKTAPVEQNIPLLLALLGIWHTNFRHAPAHAILPYATRLRRLPDYLQQVTMESNGKSVTRDGGPLDYSTAPYVFGGVGCNAQHSFYQQLHQGTQPIPSDIIIVADADDWLVANALGQAKAFYEGRQNAALSPHRQFAGQRPCTLMTMPTLNPANLGLLMALYEHKTFAEGVIWRINPFDQWGVELGKELAQLIHPALHNVSAAPDALTAASISVLRKR